MSQGRAQAPPAILALDWLLTKLAALGLRKSSFRDTWIVVVRSCFGREGGRLRIGVLSCCLPVYSIARVPSGLQGTSWVASQVRVKVLRLEMEGVLPLPLDCWCHWL